MSDEHSAAALPEKTIGIVGVGLIGGSIAAALKKRGFDGKIIGVGRSPARLQQAQQAGLIDESATEIAAAASRCNLILFCTPVDRIAAGVNEAATHAPAGALLTDAGSVKEAICRDLRGRLPQSVSFIGSHPLAGSHQNGFEHADADLFDGRLCVITPDEQTPADAQHRLTRFWKAIGMRTVAMSPAEHDAALAQTSHLPHVVASALAASLSPSNRILAATGFADSTRIAAGDPDLWSAILLANAEAVADSLQDYARRLEEFRAAVANRDADVLKNLLQLAKRNRDALD